MHDFYDRIYKRLFNNIDIIKELLLYHIKEEWVHLIDWDKISFISNEFVHNKLQKHIADVVVKLPIINSDNHLYITLIIEFQKTAFKFIIHKILQYIVAFYEILIHQDKVDLLPPIVPVVIYLGNEHWHYPTVFSKIVQQLHHSLKKYIPNFEFILIDVNEYSKESLDEMKDILTAIFNMEGSKNIKEIIPKIHRLIELYSQHPNFYLVEDFINNTISYQIKDPIKQKELRKQIKQKEVIMVAEVIQNYYKEAEQEGEYKKALETAKNMYKEGIRDIEMISRITKLPVEQIKELLK